MKYTKQELAELTKEENLRKVWQNEEKDFSPWLAENINLIADIIGVDLEVVELESKVGGFEVDILAKETNTGDYVIIENQIEQSNHDHLGKVITYAAGKNVRAAVWIVKKARDEHREAIKWLNDNTIPELGFFLLEIELWKIGDSKLAPKFNIVERPNEWAKRFKPSSNLSETQIKQFEFWQSFLEYAQNEQLTHEFRFHAPINPGSYDLSVGSTRCYIALVIKKGKNVATAGIYIPDDKELYQHFKKDKESIKESFGCQL